LHFPPQIAGRGQIFKAWNLVKLVAYHTVLVSPQPVYTIRIMDSIPGEILIPQAQLFMWFFLSDRLVSVIVKHQGKRLEVDLDPGSNGETFKYQLFSLTGVEPERQKILVKGGQLKDDTELSTLNVKPGQTFIMMGTPSSGGAGAVLGRPKEATKFLEDMTEAEAARAEGATPAGLENLGNTCYLNSTLQTLRTVPELQEELSKYRTPSGLVGLGGSMDLTACLRDLYKQMSETQGGFPPLVFLNALRTAFPQFAQKAKDGPGYAQQDAEEAWTQILSQLRQKLKIKDATSDSESDREISFIDKYLAGKFDSVLECDEPAAKEAGEYAVETSDVFLKLDCHIDKDINHLRDGILASLEEKIEKLSPALDRDAVYTKRSRISRLPKYLTVHFVRFYWKRETRKKAKIMRKVTFPAELDVVEFCTEELKGQLVPVRDKVRQIRKDEQDVERSRKRQKIAHQQEEGRKAEAQKNEPLQKKKDVEERKGKEGGSAEERETESDAITTEIFKSDAEYEAERAASILAAKKELYSLIDPKLASDDGANKSGLYELRGVITHQGASADSGHYTSYVKKQGRLVDDPKAPGGKRREEDGKWWWFNDHKVTAVEPEKIETLSGGGILYISLCVLCLDCLYGTLILGEQSRLTFSLILRRIPFRINTPLSRYRLADCGGS
jgi:ubiquitin carboxyl-terminal hydrolase 14